MSSYKIVLFRRLQVGRDACGWRRFIPIAQARSFTSQCALSRTEIDWYYRRRHGEKDEPNPYREELQHDLAAADLAKLQSALAVVVLLLSLMAHKTPDPELLEELRTPPQMQPVRRAILRDPSALANITCSA